MLQIHLSQALARRLGSLVHEPREPESTALQWFGHQVQVGGQDCVVLMELQSRYSIVFCGLTEHHFENFFDVVQDRMWREVCELVQMHEGITEEQVSLVSNLVLDLSSEQYYQKGNNRSVSSHISQVVEQLRMMVEEDGYELPVAWGEAMDFGVWANELYKKRKEDRDYFVPLLVFRDFWLGLIDVMEQHDRGELDQDREPKSEADAHERVANKVIHVDFAKGKIKK